MLHFSQVASRYLIVCLVVLIRQLTIESFTPVFVVVAMVFWMPNLLSISFQFIERDFQQSQVLKIRTEL